MNGECRSVIGVERIPSGTDRGTYVTICRRWKGHRGPCQRHVRHSQIESFYEINRRHFPNLSRPRALWSAWRTWRMTRGHFAGGAE